MEKNQAFEIIVQVVSQFRGTIQECNAVQEALAFMAKEINYSPKEAEASETTEDLEKPKGKK